MPRDFLALFFFAPPFLRAPPLFFLADFFFAPPADFLAAFFFLATVRPPKKVVAILVPLHFQNAWKIHE